MSKLISTIKSGVKKLHTLDYVILACIVFLLGLVLFFRMLRRNEWVTVLVRIQQDQIWWESNPPPWYTQSLSGKQEAYNSFGRKTASINKVQSFETAEGRNETLTEIYLKVLYDPLRHQYQYNYQPVLIGKSIEIPFPQFSLIGVVLGINTQITYVNKNIEVRLLAIPPWRITDLVKGLRAVDAEGNVVAEITDINIQNAQSYRFTDLYGRQNVVQSEDPTRKDVTMKVKMRSVKYNSSFYSVYGSPIKIGASLNLQFPSTSVNFAEISAIYD